MIAQYQDSFQLENNLLRQIAIKDRQLEIARESDMPYVTKELQSQLSKLQSRLLELQNPEFAALMSLLDD
ncbi:MAG: hypothetical protein PUP93_29085 [Rhizonema sp. NSF051]|nr:hypothetical protein [Rhizonema sp. NSF051]